MGLKEGPIIFLTDGSVASVALLPEVAAFAATLAPSLTLLHLHRRNNDESQALERHRLEQEVAKLEPPLPYQSISSDNLFPTLSQLADDANAPDGYARGILALLPTRHHPIRRLFALNNYDRLLHRGPFAILALPKSFRHKTIAKVLFPTDLAPRSDDALTDTITLCHHWQAELHLLHSFGDDDRLPEEKNPAARATARTPRQLMQIDIDRLDELAKRARESGLTVITQYGEGKAHSDILNYVRTHTIDLVVMSTHGARKYEDVIYGTTTTQVIQKASVPILALRG